MGTVEITLKNKKVHVYTWADVTVQNNNIDIILYSYDSILGMYVKKYHKIYNVMNVLSVKQIFVDNNDLPFEYHE